MSKKTLLLFCLAFITSKALLFAQVKDGIPRGYRAIPWTRYEADSATQSFSTSTTSISYSQTEIQGEASHQRCVRMNSSGSALEWTLTNPGDGIVFRYSIPDGSSAELRVRLNGADMGIVTMGSNYAWQCLPCDSHGSNTNTTNPNLKMKFDEVRMRMASVGQVGQTLRVERVSGDIHLDFIEVEEVPAKVQPEAGDVVYTGTGSNFQSFLNVHQGGSIYIQNENIWVGEQLYLGVNANGTTIKGGGSWHTNIHFTNPSSGGIRADGYDCSLMGFHMNTVNTERSGNYHAISGTYTGGSVLSDLWVEHFETGAWIRSWRWDGQGAPYADNFEMVNCRFRNNYADGINLNQGTRNGHVHDCHFRNNGDDAVAIWPANAGMVTMNNVLEYLTIENNWRAGGVSLYGGQNNTFRNIVIRDNVEAGIKVNNNFPGESFSGVGMQVFENIEIINCGTQNNVFKNPLGAIDIYCRDFYHQRVENVQFSNITIEGSKNDALNIEHNSGQGFYNLVFENVFIDGTGAEFPDNNIDGDGNQRGFAIKISGEPGGYATYCNITYVNRGGNASSWLDYNDIGGFSWTEVTGCDGGSVTLASPADGEMISECVGSILLEANAFVNTGAIDKVEFYMDEQKVGEDMSFPFEYEWMNPTPGVFSVRAVVSSSTGSVSQSDVSSFTVIKGVYPTSISPDIEGTIDAVWDEVEPTTLDKQLFGGGGISGPSDLSAQFRVTLDNNFLYWLVEVQDESLIQDSDETENWKDDKVEVYVDLGNDKSSTYGNDDHAYGFVHGVPLFYAGPGSSTNGKFRQGIVNGGYFIEARIPWSTLGGTPAYGDLMGLEVMVGDDDDGDTRDSKIAWTDETDNSWNNPSLFGTVQLFPATQTNSQVCAGENFTYPDGSVETDVQDNAMQRSVITGSTGCDSTVITNLTVTDVSPIISASGNELSVSPSGSNHQWVDCNNGNGPIPGETNAVFEALENGLYAVAYEVNGCLVQSDCEQVTGVGFSEFEEGMFELYPSPASNVVTVNASLSHAVPVVLRSALGVEIKRIESVRFPLEINVEGLTPGVYFIEVDHQYVQRLIVK